MSSPGTIFPHTFIPAAEGDSRSPCPALNTLANHGYLPRHGRDITFSELITAMRAVYSLSLPLAILLALAGILLCGHGMRLDLDGLAAHNKIEHDGSLVHGDAAPGSKTAPVPVDHALLQKLLTYAAPKCGLSLADMARARFEREAHLATPLGHLHAEIAAGESALTWLLMKDERGEVPVERLAQWFGEERIPDGWKKPAQIVGLLEARGNAKNVAEAMNALGKKGESASQITVV